MPRKVLVWVFDARGQALLLRRARSVSVPGWHPVTGNVDEGEDLREAARREVLEETGLSVQPVALGLVTTFERYGEVREEHAFAARAAGEPRLSGEHDAAEWVDPEEAAARVAFPFQREALTAAAKRIGRPI